MMDLLTKDSPKLALNFLITDLGIPEEDQEYFAVLSARPIGSNWDVVEIGIEGLPDNGWCRCLTQVNATPAIRLIRRCLRLKIPIWKNFRSALLKLSPPNGREVAYDCRCRFCTRLVVNRLRF